MIDFATSPILKKCSKCKKEKPFLDFGKNKNQQDGLHHYCKMCRKVWCENNQEKITEYSLNWRRKNPEKYKLIQKSFLNKRPEYNKRYKEKNKEKILERSRLWAKKFRDENPEKARAIYNKWAKNNPEKVKELHKKWRSNNTEKTKEMYRSWVVSNREKVRLNNHRRRARISNACGWNYTTEQHVKWRWQMWGNKCWMCGNDARQTDHVIPLKPNYRKKAGSHWPSNLRPSCKSCNSSKNCRKPTKHKTNII